MATDPGLHGTNQTNVIRDPAVMRQEFTKIHADMAIAREFPGAREKLAALLNDIIKMDLAVERLQVMPLQLRFRIAQIHLTRTALHKHRDHGRSLRPQGRYARFQIKLAAL